MEWAARHGTIQGWIEVLVHDLKGMVGNAVA